MGKYFVVVAVCLVTLVSANAPGIRGEDALVLENDRLGLRFDRKTGTLTAMDNKLTGETYRVNGDEFAVEAVEFRLDLSETKLTSLKLRDGVLHVRYGCSEMTIEVAYTLGGENHFVEKRMILTADRDYGLKKVVLSRPTFSADDLKIAEYRYPKFKRPPGTEPDCTLFGRTAKGGFFVGVEMPFDASSVTGNQVVLAYAPSLKVRKDLPDWPAAGKVDGSAHIVGDRGFVFLFNSNTNPLEGRFALTEECVGLKHEGTFEVSQDFPESDRSIRVLHGETVHWEIPGETAVILDVQSVDQ